jgi:Ni/Co efflux regulator RcnB
MTPSGHRKTTVATAIVLAIMTSALVAGSAGAQPYGGDRGGQRAGWGQDYGGAHQWRRGQQIGYNDWNGAQPVDYRSHHLRRPPSGYEWRESNGQYVMAAIATGVIASIILSHGR